MNVLWKLTYKDTLFGSSHWFWDELCLLVSAQTHYCLRNWTNIKPRSFDAVSARSYHLHICFRIVPKGDFCLEFDKLCIHYSFSPLLYIKVNIFTLKWKDSTIFFQLKIKLLSALFKWEESTYCLSQTCRQFLILEITGIFPFCGIGSYTFPLLLSL